ncbi:MAG: GGDEF domain-containing protein, partial [Butyrivibrio sp.]|nr:GGDEF domain-containing protein [Butyrivibrio sp.]
KMQICVTRSMEEGGSSFGKENAVPFRTETMIPILDAVREKPSVFYFSPVHFDGVLLGYAVLQRELSGHPVLNVIYRNWIRYLNNALEMMRIRERLQSISVRDEMTGVYNRRGMYAMYRSMLSEAREGDALFVSVADMDGLKYINDTFGHSEGDFGIRTVCDTLQSVARGNEICVRSGGDEFFLIGIGPYGKEDEAERAREFAKAIVQASG